MTPYDTIELLPFNDHGWFCNGEQIESLIKTHPIRTIIEVGSWLGCSTRFMASLLPEGGKVYAVDHWLGSPEHQPGQYAHHSSLPILYEQFLSNVIHSKLTHVIVPIRLPSLEAALDPSLPLADLIYIDAGHDPESVYADLKAWYPRVRKGGVLCGDDWTWDSVRIAVEIFAEKKQLKIQSDGNFWRYTGV